jgi:hypothetical protein
MIWSNYATSKDWNLELLEQRGFVRATQKSNGFSSFTQAERRRGQTVRRPPLSVSRLTQRLYYKAI